MTAGRRRVLLLHPILQDGARILSGHCDVVSYPASSPIKTREMVRAAIGCEAIVCQGDPITEEVLAVPGLRIVANVTRNYGNVDLDAADRHGVMITNTPLDPTNTIADFALCLMLAAARRVVEADRFMRTGEFTGWTLEGFLGRDLFKSTLGLIGLGKVGRAIARRARGFGMRVLAFDPSVVPPVDHPRNVEAVDLRQLLEQADFICVYPASPGRSAHLVGRDELAWARPNSVLVTMAPGVVDEEALAEALSAGRLFAAALDAFEREPHIPEQLRALHNVVLTPHIHSSSEQLRCARSIAAATDVVAALDGRRPRYLVNPHVFLRTAASANALRPARRNAPQGQDLGAERDL